MAKVGPTKHRTGVLHGARGDRRLLFAMLSPDNRLNAVLDAHDMDAAWVIGTGWEDQDGIEQRKRQGWKIVPCMVEWEE